MATLIDTVSQIDDSHGDPDPLECYYYESGDESESRCPCRSRLDCFFGRIFWGGQRPLVPFFLLGPPFFQLFFLVHHLVDRDDRHLLAHAMASDFSVAWQCLSNRTIVFFVTDLTPRPGRIFFVFKT
jgi:hypothetical protein